MAARSLDVTFDIPAEHVLVDGNAADLEALLVNLVGNALKLTEDGGWVRCRLHVDAHSVLLEVSDNGLGIPRDEQRELFTRFFRSSTAQERAIEGTGLGMAIVDAIVQAHGGDIAVHAEQHAVLS